MPVDMNDLCNTTRAAVERETTDVKAERVTVAIVALVFTVFFWGQCNCYIEE